MGIVGTFGNGETIPAITAPSGAWFYGGGSPAGYGIPLQPLLIQGLPWGYFKVVGWGVWSGARGDVYGYNYLNSDRTFQPEIPQYSLQVTTTTTTYLPTPNTYTGNPKDAGKPDCEQAQGNPINAGTGNKVQEEVDYTGAELFPLQLIRTYNSQITNGIGFGVGWRSNYGARVFTPNATTVWLSRPDGKLFTYSLAGGVWTTDADTTDKLVQVQDTQGKITGWTYTQAAGTVETYNAIGMLASIRNRAGLTQIMTYTASTAAAPIAGLLLTVADSFGRNLSFTYDAAKRVSTMTDPVGGVYTYAYDANSRLISVTYPEGAVRQYVYDDGNYLRLLTGIIDENGNRYATWTYDASGKAISSEHGTGVEKVTLTYNPGSTMIVDALGTTRTQSFSLVANVTKSTGQSQPGGAGCSAASSATTYDANGNVASRADFNGNKSCYAYDPARNLETARVEGLASGSVCPADVAAYTPVANTAQRKILTAWHPSFRLPVKITEAGRETTTVYDSRGTLTSRSIKDLATAKTRTWTTTPTYHPSIPGVLVQTVDDGPRIDVADITTTDYYAPDAACPGAALMGCRGQVRQIANALGHITTYNEYDAHGHITKLTDPNAVVTTFAYTPRGWLASRNVDGKTTTYDYTPWGGLAKLTYPDATWIGYSYDPAHRLTGIIDSAGRRVDYTLDNAGNRIKETFVNADATQAREVNRVFDELGRIKDEIEGAVGGALPRSYGYYANGEAQFSTTPKGDTSSDTIDALGRTVQQTDPVNGAVKPTLMQYDSLDQLTALTAPNGAATAFTYDKLGNLTQETSADRGTLDATYDDAGNQLTGRDARGLTVAYQYDALDRLIQASSPAAATLPARSRVYTWDSAPGCNYGVGRLCRIADGAGSTTFAYDARGNLVSETRAEDGASFVTNYFHNDADRLTDVTSPSGEAMQAGLDASGQIKTLATTRDGVVTQVADGIEYAATGQIRRQTLGQTVIEQSYDDAGRLYTGAATVSTAPSDGDVPLPAWALWLLGAGLMGAIARKRAATASLALVVGLIFATSFHPSYAVDLDLDYDANGNVITKATPGGTTTFSYDPLDRIDTEAGPAGSRNHDFDAGGNRTTDGAGTTAGFTPNTDRLATINGVAIALDAAGNLTSDGTYKYLWNGFNQLEELRKADNTLIATYYYDYRNLRTRKVTTSAAPQGISKTFYHYNQAGHLIAETTPGNTPQATYIWNGDILTGFIVHQPTRTVYTVQTDHLGSPFQVRTLAGQVVWRWESEAFGKTAPNEDVDGDGNKLTLNLRFPGQYFDKESGLHYNWNRYYSPKLGRYLSPDPIGLSGGPNLYSYAKQNPLKYVDPDGKNPLTLGGALLIGGAVIVSGAVQSLQHAKDPSGGQFDPPLPKPIDPYTETDTTAKTAPNFPTKNPMDCEARYSEDKERCRSGCGDGSIGAQAFCLAKAWVKYRACRRIYNSGGSDWTNW